MLGMATIAMLWLGLGFLLADHHGAMAAPGARQAIFLPAVILLTALNSSP